MDTRKLAQNLLGTSRQAFSWWVSELSACVPPRLRNLAKARRAELRLDRNQVALRRDGRPVPGAVWPRAELTAQTVAPFLRGGSLQVRASKNVCLVQRISLPLVVQSSLDAALAFEVDRRTPFRAADVLIGHRLLPRQDRERTLTVDMICVPKRLIMPLLDAVAANGAQIANLRVDLDGDLVDLPLTAGPALRSKTRRLRSAAYSVGALAALVAALVPIQRVEFMAESMEASLATLKEAAGRSTEMEARLQAETTLQDAVRTFRSQVSALAALAEMSRVLGDATHVTSLYFTDGRIEIDAVGGSAAVVARDVEASPLFEGTSLRGTVVPLGSGNDEFGLVARVATQNAKGGV